MLYVDLFRDEDRQGGFVRFNSSYGEARTLQAARDTFANPKHAWAKAYEVLNESGDILCVGFRCNS